MSSHPPSPPLRGSQTDEVIDAGARMECLASWLARSTQMEVQARQSRSLLTIGPLTLGAALAALLINDEIPILGMLLGGLSFLVTLFCALVLNHYYDWKTTAWCLSAKGVQEAQAKLLNDPSFWKMDRSCPDILYRYYRKNIKIVVIDWPSAALYFASFLIVGILAFMYFQQAEGGTKIPSLPSTAEHTAGHPSRPNADGHDRDGHDKGIAKQSQHGPIGQELQTAP